MSKRIEDLAFKYNINASVSELNRFVTEIYNEGYYAGKETQLAKVIDPLRDHFAGLAMQGLIGNLTKEESCDTLADDAYHMADAMLEAREKDDE
jgi:hypothetical protein